MELYERIVVNRELDKVEQLARRKDAEIGRLESYHQRRQDYNRQKADIDRMGDSITGKDQEVLRL